MGDLIGNKIDNRLTIVSDHLETVTNGHDEEIPKKDIYLQKKSTKILII